MRRARLFVAQLMVRSNNNAMGYHINGPIEIGEVVMGGRFSFWELMVFLMHTSRYMHVFIPIHYGKITNL